MWVAHMRGQRSATEDTISCQPGCARGVRTSDKGCRRHVEGLVHYHNVIISSRETMTQ